MIDIPILLSVVTNAFPAVLDTVPVVADTVLSTVEMIAAEEHGGITSQMMTFVLQIAILIFAAHIGGRLASKIKLPGVIGELLAGIVVGPYLLGGIAIPKLFEHGIFPLPAVDAVLSVSPELYGFATLASIILLFMTGLETDLEMFIRYSLAGTVIGVGGATMSMIAGMAIGPMFFNVSMTDPLSLFLGVLCTATSVGITARILSEKRKIDSSEGVTILAGAVIDDVLGIICLAVVMGVVDAKVAHADGVAWSASILTGLKAVLTWVICTALGLWFAHKISTFLKNNYHAGALVAAALGLALLLGALFEIAGLAMIIGAYVVGLSLSKTDLKFMLMERLHDLYSFFVPVFFAVMGALVDVRQFADPRVLQIGLIYGVLAVLAKIIGCSLPAFGLKFNWRGALRIGVGMVPRGEVALIIAGLGAAKGILDQESFGVVILMTLLSTIIAPPMLSYLLDMPGRGTKRDDDADSDTQSTRFDFPHPTILDMMIDKLRQTFAQEGFFITRMDLEDKVYQMRKDELAFSMTASGKSVEFSSPSSQVFFIKTAVYETLIELLRSIEVIKEMNKPEDIRHNLAEAAKDAPTVKNRFGAFNPFQNAVRTDCIRLRLMNTQSKADTIRELVDILGDAGVIEDRESLYHAVMEREEQISTGLQDGVAIPHAKIDGIDEVHMAIGICPEGMDFGSLDGKPTTLIVLLVSPAQHPAAHLQCLAALGDRKSVV